MSEKRTSVRTFGGPQSWGFGGWNLICDSRPKSIFDHSNKKVLLLIEDGRVLHGHVETEDANGRCYIQWGGNLIEVIAWANAPMVDDRKMIFEHCRVLAKNQIIAGIRESNGALLSKTESDIDNFVNWAVESLESMPLCPSVGDYFHSGRSYRRIARVLSGDSLNPTVRFATNGAFFLCDNGCCDYSGAMNAPENLPRVSLGGEYKIDLVWRFFGDANPGCGVTFSVPCRVWEKVEEVKVEKS